MTEEVKVKRAEALMTEEAEQEKDKSANHASEVDLNLEANIESVSAGRAGLPVYDTFK